MDSILKISESALNPREEAVSILTFIASFPPVLSDDLEATAKELSKILFHCLDTYDEEQFCDRLLCIVEHIKDRPYINVSSHQKIFIRDSYLFRITLFVSLKHVKFLFLRCPLNSQYINNFLSKILLNILDDIHIDRAPSIHLVRLILLIVKKRGDVVDPNLAFTILKCMNKVAVSPLTSFKRCAHDISRIVIHLLSSSQRSLLNNLSSIPLTGVDFSDNLKLILRKESVQRFAPRMCDHILKLFCNNVSSRDGGAYYNIQIQFYEFEEFKRCLWPLYKEHLQHFEEEGEFYQSLLKYWIPISIMRYESQFYSFVRDEDVSYHVKGHVLLESKRRGIYGNEEFDSDAVDFLQYSQTCVIGLGIISTYTSKFQLPNENEIGGVKFYLNCYAQDQLSDSETKALKRFISQIFCASHVHLNKKNSYYCSEMYTEFLRYLYTFCDSNLNEETCEVITQILRIILNITCGSSDNLVASYKVDRENVYGPKENGYYKLLKENGFLESTFFSKTLIGKLRYFTVTNSKKLCPNLIHLVVEHYLQSILIGNGFGNFVSLLGSTVDSISLFSSEKMKLYSNLVVAYKRLTSEDCECAALKKIFGRHVNNLDVTCLFHCVLLLDIFMELRKYHSTDLTSIIESSLRFFGRIFDDELHNHMDIKTTKVLEAYINSVIECLVVSKHHWDVFPKDHVLNQLCKIIKKSNMKRPLSLAINAVQHFGTHMEHEDKDREIKIRLLDKTLRSLVNTQKKQTTMIRRNPETRLVIHALCLSDDDSEKPYVDWSLRFLLKTACDAEAPDLTISSTLHCLEVLVSDNSIHQVTLPYVPRIVDCCIEIFNKKSWTVRNANLQLLKSLIGRLYGVPLDHYRRYKTVEDLFTLFPELTVTLFKVLFVPNLKDDAIVALLFFSESQLKKNLLIEESLEEVFKVFRGVFVQIVKSYSNKFGVLAVKSLTALCVDAKIAVVFRDVVQYIENNFAKMKKTFFKNFVLLLRDLYNKHRTSLDKCNGHIIDMSMGKLRTFLRQYDYFCFNLLSLKLFPLNDVIHEVFVKLNILQNYKARIWLDNYVPFVLSTIKIQHMPGFLQNVLFAKNSPAFLQVKILSILADRLSILYRDRNVEIRIVMTILLHRITELKDSDNFLVTSYAKSIFLLNEMINDLFISPSLLDNIRRDCETKNIYKMIIYVLVFSYLNKDDRTIEDSRFLSRCLDSCMEVSEDDDDILFDISSTLMQFYKCCPPQSRYSIFKLAFRLLLRIPTCFEICKFVSSLTTSRCSAALICLNTFLSPDNLRACFDDQNLIIKLLLDLYCDVRDLPEEYEESGTFYLFQNDYSLPKLHIRRVIKRSLSTVLLCIQF